MRRRQRWQRGIAFAVVVVWTTLRGAGAAGGLRPGVAGTGGGDDRATAPAPTGSRPDRRGSVDEVAAGEGVEIMSVFVNPLGGVSEAMGGGVGEGDKGLLHDSVRATLEANDETVYPWCLYLRPLEDVHLACHLMQLVMDIMVAGPPDFEKLAYEHSAGDNLRVLPEPFEDLRGRMPKLIPPLTVREEKASYAFFQRHVYNMYAYVYRVADATHGKDVEEISRREGILPLAPQGWGAAGDEVPERHTHLQATIHTATANVASHRRQRVYYEVDSDGYQWPIAQSIGKGGHLVFLIRGTMFSAAWKVDYTYQFVDRTYLAKWGLPGRVHAGVANYTSSLLAQWDRDPDMTGITKVTFAGHSLGGAVGTLAAAVFALRYPQVQVNTMSMAAPEIGDPAFADYLACHVNLRRLTYLGSAFGTAPGLSDAQANSGVGDVIPQIPTTCKDHPVPVCRNIEMLRDITEEKSYDYAHTHGVVPFYVTDLDNQERWLEIDPFPLPDIQKTIIYAMAKHVCTYPCWLAQSLNDVEDRCFFTDQGGSHRYRCDIQRLLSISARFPWLQHRTSS